MDTGSDERQPSYGDIRERNKRKEHLRDEKLKRRVETQRDRHLHSFEARSTAGRGPTGSST